MAVTSLFIADSPSLLDIEARDARYILAARSWCIFRRSRQDPLPQIRNYLQSGAVAMRFALLMNAVNQVWPDPFAAHRPCCPVASVDEMLLARIITLAATHERPAFDALLEEMLSSEARDLLYARAQTLYRDTLA